MKWLFFRRPLPTIASVAERDLLEGEGSASPLSLIHI